MAHLHHPGSTGFECGACVKLGESSHWNLPGCRHLQDSDPVPLLLPGNVGLLLLFSRYLVLIGFSEHLSVCPSVCHYTLISWLGVTGGQGSSAHEVGYLRDVCNSGTFSFLTFHCGESGSAGGVGIGVMRPLF